MSGMSKGNATFASCNKAGSIPFYTQHISQYPNHYPAHIWRGRAYSIIGQHAHAKADFQHAARVSSGPQKNLALAHIEHIDGNMAKKEDILRSTTRSYPTFAEAWNDLGTHSYFVNKRPDTALEELGKASDLGINNGETQEPWFPWCRQTMGDIYYEKHEIDNAKTHFIAAVGSCPSLTVGHLGMSKCDILNKNYTQAESSFRTARNLNPTLVQFDAFNEFRDEVQTQYSLETQLLNAFESLLRGAEAGGTIVSPVVTEISRPLLQSSEHQRTPRIVYSANPHHSRDTKSREAHSSSVSGGSRHGGGGSGDGSGSDDDDLTPEERKQIWEKIKKEAPSRKKYKGMRFYQSKCGKFWYSKIDENQRHGRETKSFLKKYADKGRTIELIGSVDENMKDMTGKHESGKYASIKKCEMDGF